MKKLIIPITIILITLISVGGYFIKENNREDLNYFINSEPNYEFNPYYGNENSSIDLIIYLDPTSTEDKKFMKNIFPKLKDEYIHTGKIKFYNKNYLTEEDYLNKNERFIYAQSLSCIKTIDKEKYYDIYFEIFNKDLISTLEDQNFDLEAFKKCIEEETFQSIIEDYYEIEKRGLIGASPWIYVGIKGTKKTRYMSFPGEEIFRRNIRTMETQIGK